MRCGLSEPDRDLVSSSETRALDNAAARADTEPLAPCQQPARGSVAQVYRARDQVEIDRLDKGPPFQGAPCRRDTFACRTSTGSAVVDSCNDGSTSMHASPTKPADGSHIKGRRIVPPAPYMFGRNRRATPRAQRAVVPATRPMTTVRSNFVAGPALLARSEIRSPCRPCRPCRRRPWAWRACRREARRSWLRS